MMRLLTALVLTPAALWLALAAPGPVFLAALVAVGMAAHREYDHIVQSQGAGGGWTATLLGAFWSIVPAQWALPGLMILTGVLLARSLRLPALSLALPHAAAGVLGVVYIFGAWRCAASLRGISPHWLVIALMVSWAGDTAAMYIGKAMGRHKLAPRLSPGKTWEGAAASVAGGTLAAAVYGHYLLPAVGIAPVAGIAALANIAGQVGDLAESALKRGAGVKDSGASLPGHGGWLDRIDSSLFSVPAAYALVLLWSHIPG